MYSSSLKQTSIQSPLSQMAIVRPKAASTKRTLVSSLMLTSLVDAFSILVIFLLMNTKSGIEQVELKKINQLPHATAMDTVTKGIVLRIEDNKYFVDEVQVSEATLAQKLEEAKTKFEAGTINGLKASVIVQADKKLDYEAVSPILRAGAAAGLNQFKFAVVEKSN